MGAIVRGEANAAGSPQYHFVPPWNPVTSSPKYVNMADINARSVTVRPLEVPPSRAAEFDLIELLFFAYRDFVGDADDMLLKIGFGRAHHRVLHFVNRNPGMKVAELLDILRITKQSLGRVLKQLIDEGYVEQKEGASDRRQRLLFVTPKGEALAQRLVGLQSARIARALAEPGGADRGMTRRFLVAMLDPARRENVLRLIEGGGRSRRRA
jgi:DNA-binding MarR family transcriptional regulator